MGLRSWIKKKAALHVLDNMAEKLTKKGVAVDPKIKEFVEGAVAFVAPIVLTEIATRLGEQVVIDWRALLALSVASLAAYIRTRPTKQ